MPTRRYLSRTYGVSVSSDGTLCCIRLSSNGENRTRDKLPSSNFRLNQIIRSRDILTWNWQTDHFPKTIWLKSRDLRWVQYRSSEISATWILTKCVTSLAIGWNKEGKKGVICKYQIGIYRFRNCSKRVAGTFL